MIREQPKLHLLKPSHRSIFGFPEQKHTVFAATVSTASLLKAFVATVLKFLKHENLPINFYSKLSGSSVCIVSSRTGRRTYGY